VEHVNILVIGAGAVGLAIGYELSKAYPEVVVIDKESSFGKHTSSRNSEVIHGGLYYPPKTLKAELCVQGNQLLYRFLQDYGIAHSNTGKIIVATSTDEVKTVEKYYQQGVANGCKGLRFIPAEEVHDLEPLVKCIAGLYVPSTGILDTHEYMHTLSNLIEEQGSFLVYGLEVTRIRNVDGKYQVYFSNNEIFETNFLINSAGLWSDKVAEMAGIDITTQKLILHLCKGEYYKTTKIKNVKHLVYPVADPQGIFLGIHLTINLNGEVRFGPNAYYIDTINYKFDEEYYDDFYTSINRYLEINKDDLIPDDTGIRPKLQGPEDSVQDFYIREESASGYPHLVNLIGIESPGLTASLAIARHVKNIMQYGRSL
jgi:L-2-hydroxyglutarate oxidase LhgO